MASTKHRDITDPEVQRSFEGGFRKVERIPPGLDTPCWIWQRAKDADGYGQQKFNGVLYKAHRLSYMIYIGEPEPGMDVDHKCETRSCVNPDHLELVTHHENMRRQRTHHGGDADDPNVPDGEVEPEIALAAIVELLHGIPTEQPIGIGSIEGTPWRECDDLESFDPRNKWQRVALFLYAVEVGIKPRIAAETILGVSQHVIHTWSQRNPEWKRDMDAARLQSQTHRWRDYRDGWFDRAERKLVSMSADDLAKHGRLIVQKDSIDADERGGGKKKGQPALTQGGNNYFLVINGDPSKLIDDIIDSTARVIPEQLPSPDDEA